MNDDFSTIEDPIFEPITEDNTENLLNIFANEKKFFNNIFDTIREGMIFIGRNLKITYSNQAAKTILGLDDNCNGQRISKLLREVDWMKHISQAMENQSIGKYELELFYPTHKYISYYIIFVEQNHFSDISDENQPYAAIIIHDISEEIKKNEKNIEAERLQALTMLTAGVAHELGNPLNSLSINLQLFNRSLRKVEDPQLKSELKECLDIAQQEVARLDGIITNFLAAVRPAPINSKPISIIAALSEILEFMKTEIADRNIKVNLVNNITGIPISGDIDQLKQAFFNLIKNAIQAMPNDGCLTISCFENEDFININFIDTGGGIPPQILTHITEPYYSTKSKGNGLGLLIVERIVRAHGGRLVIESKEGIGSIFSIQLPTNIRRSRLLK